MADSVGSDTIYGLERERGYEGGGGRGGERGRERDSVGSDTIHALEREREVMREGESVRGRARERAIRALRSGVWGLRSTPSG